jgi:hypothetical protein
MSSDITCPIGKPALDAMTDQSFAEIRDHRACAPAASLRLSEEAAALLAEQFPGQLETAGRVAMSIVQMLEGWARQIGEEAEVIGPFTDVLALAAEQVAREASTR